MVEATEPEPGRRVHLISLGCPKNRVDSEVMVGKLQSGPFELVDDPEHADVIVVNTCSFIQSATEESVDTVLRMSRYKSDGSCRKLVVTGCMVQRYGRALEGELPEVDHFLGTGEYHRIDAVLLGREDGVARSYIDTPLYLADDVVPRVNSWAPHSAYLKISEGCDRRCAFCIIPKLRGVMRSRTIPSLVNEARRLAEQGVVELNLVSQDSTVYGRDLHDGSGLGPLLRALARVDGIRWIRLHYLYPHGIPDAVLRAIAEEEKVVPYVDMPLQHASPRMLRAMRRGVTPDGQARVIERIRAAVPNVALRTTFIVGFPGETDADYEQLRDFVQAQRFDHLGVFTYFQEDGTAAAELDGQLPDAVKQARQQDILSIQKRVSRERLKQLVGVPVEVLVDGVSDESEWILRGRMATQAPDVDGQVYLLSAPAGVRAGQFVNAKITKASAYDLVADLGATS